MRSAAVASSIPVRSIKLSKAATSPPANITAIILPITVRVDEKVRTIVSLDQLRYQAAYDITPEIVRQVPEADRVFCSSSRMAQRGDPARDPLAPTPRRQQAIVRRCRQHQGEERR